jgi:starch-binding outer membrane protein, SusD/RagB family
MKKLITYLLYSAAVLLGFSSCEEYLDRTPSAALSEKDIFGKYSTFQGYEDQLPLFITEPLQWQQGAGMWFSDETHSSAPITSSYQGINGDYWTMLTGGANPRYSLFVNSSQGGRSGFWNSSWYGIRVANMSLKQLSALEAAQTATQEQKDLLKGNAKFFRGYFHYELFSIWGGLPYIDTLLTADMDINFPRPPLQISMRKSVNDLLAAAQLLPKSWDETAVGAATPGKNTGRPTKGSAYGMAAKALLFMGSPLNNDGYVYNEALCKESAQYGWEVIKLADAGYHKLQNVTEDKGDPDVNDYKRNFSGANATASPYTSENLFVRYTPLGFYDGGWGIIYTSLSQNMFPKSNRGTGVAVAPSQNLVDLFETTNGKLPEDDPSYNPLTPWVNRDPRFYNVILTDGTSMSSNYTVNCYAYDDAGAVGPDFGTGQTETGYFIKKWWIYGVAAQGGTRSDVRIWTPILRLAEVYLNYTEALIGAGYAPTDQPVFLNGETGLSALDAMNRLRQRIYTKTNAAILPDIDMALNGVAGKDGTVKGSFMKKIWDERAVELCFERSRWIDLRRWHVAHLDKYRNIYGMRYNKTHTKFDKVLLSKINFESKHYWMPLPTSQIGLYQEYNQNPGW